MEKYATLSSINPENNVVLLRLDLNVPMKDGRVIDATRIERSLPTIKALIARDAKIVILSHFGRPKAKEPHFSLRQLIDPLSKAIGKKVAFAEDCIGPVARDAVMALKKGDILLLENLRFHYGEEKNDPEFSKALASLGDYYVNDAFSCAHRAHASTEGLAHLLPAAAGLAMEKEIKHLAAILEQPEHPVIALIGGAKVSTKLDLLWNLCTKVDMLAVGGGMANTFLLAQGHEIGKSLAERDMVDKARAILQRAQEHHCQVILPMDLSVAKELRDGVSSRDVDLKDMPPDAMILDIGSGSIEMLKTAIKGAKSLVWNGPLGAFEVKPFDRGTESVAAFVASLTKARKIVSVAGGGDTVAALASHGGEFTYLSTAGGAFLEWLEGKDLPGVSALRIT